MSCVKTAFITVTLIHSVISVEDKVVEQIYRGEPASKAQYPFLVRLYTYEPVLHPLCTGSIVQEDKILTAGHCCTRSGEKYAVFGHADQEKFYREAKKTGNLNVTGFWAYRVLSEAVHPGYQAKRYTVIHDVCVVTLEKPMSAADGHEVIPISYSEFFARQCTAVGWGQTEENKLQFKLYQKNVFAEVAWRGNWLIRLYFHAICSGDSGGPLICGGKIYGVASFSTEQLCSVSGTDYYAYLRQEKSFLGLYIDGAFPLHESRFKTPNRVAEKGDGG